MSLDTRPAAQIDLEHPWIGLESFSESTRCYFFGRDAEAAELLQRLRLHPLLVLYGRSGLGKTSLLRARLVPNLENLKARPVFYRIGYRKAEDSSPLEQLAIALKARERIELPGLVLPNDPASRLWLNLHHRERKDRITHLILDQFEEIFTLGAEWPGADAEVREALAIFVQGAIPLAIETLLDEGEAFLKHFHLDVPPLHVLLSVRQDYVFALNRWRNHLRQLGENHYELRALRGPAAFEAVFKPGELRSHHRGEVSEETKTDTGLPPLVSEETAKRIVHFVADEKEDVSLEEIEAVPPILSLLCRELNERRFTSEQPAAQITFHKGETDIETIIATFYERCLAGRPEAVRIFIEEELVSRYSSARLQQDERSILKVFADGCAIPGAARRAEGYGNPGGARACLEDLVNQRLLTAIGGDNPGYELIHDLLAAVVEKGRTAREEQERVEKERAEERAREAATRAAVLDAALQRETQARRSADLARRRARWLAGAAILVALIAVAAFVAALAARAEADRLLKVVSEQDYYIAHRLISEGDPNLALNYLARSVHYDPKNELARMALGQVLLFNQNFPFKLAAAPLRHEGEVYSAAFSPDGKLVVTAGSDKTARVWEAATGKAIGEPLRNDGVVFRAAFSPDGKFVVTASLDKTARVWEAATGKAIGEPLRHEGEVFSAAFSPDGKFVVTAGSDKTARVWEAATGKAIGEPLRNDGVVYSAAFSPDGKFLVTASSDKTARVWEAATGKAIGEPLRHEGEVTSAAFSPDGKFLVTASSDKTARVWEAATGKAIGEPLRNDGVVYSAAFSPDGKFLVTASSDKTARVWEAATGKAIGEPLRHEGEVTSAAFSSNGKFLVTATLDKTARVWEAATGKAIGEPLRHEDQVFGAAFSPDGKFVVTASSDKTARVWEAATGKAIGEPLRHEDQVFGAAFSPDGKFVVTASLDKTARVWEATTGKAIGEPLRHEGEVYSAAFSPDGKFVVTAGSDKTARVWEAATGKAIGEPLRHEGEVTSAAFSPDGKFVVTAGSDKTARVWEAATGKAIGEPLRHEGEVTSAAFSPDGKFVVTASRDGTARVWEAATGKAIGEPLRHEGQVYSAAFSPDGKFVVTAGSDKTARVCRWSNPLSDSPGKIAASIEQITFRKIAQDGGPAWISPKTPLINGQLSESVSWFSEPTRTRTIWPGAMQTVPQFIVSEIQDARRFRVDQERAKRILDNAYPIDPTHPLIHIALAMVEGNEQTAAFLRDYDLKRLPESCSYTKDLDPKEVLKLAAEMCAEQGDEERAQIARDKLKALEGRP